MAVLQRDTTDLCAAGLFDRKLDRPLSRNRAKVASTIEYRGTGGFIADGRGRSRLNSSCQEFINVPDVAESRRENRFPSGWHRPERWRPGLPRVEVTHTPQKYSGQFHAGDLLNGRAR